MSLEATERINPAKKLALYAAVGTIVLAAAITVWAIIANPPGDTVGKAILTLLLMAAFAFSAIGEASATHRPNYVVMGRITALVLVVAGGLTLTWDQIDERPWFDLLTDLWGFIQIVILLEAIGASLLLGHPRWSASMKTAFARNTFNFGFVTTLAVLILLALPNALQRVVWDELYWRIVLATAVISLVALVLPLIVNAILRPARTEVTSVPRVTASPAGWYPSERPGVERFWDGAAWTAGYRPMAGIQEAPPVENSKESN